MTPETKKNRAMKQTENQKLAMLSAKIKSFPSLPSVVNHVMKITADPKSSVEDLIDAINPDLALNTAILKISNSVFFGQMRKVSSLKQALMVIGFSEIQNIVLSKAVFNSFKKISVYNAFDMNCISIILLAIVYPPDLGFFLVKQVLECFLIHHEQMRT